MYKKVDTDLEINWGREGNKVKPLVTLADEYGARAQIIEDDNCYVLLLKIQALDVYIQTCWWFKEAAAVIKELL